MNNTRSNYLWIGLDIGGANLKAADSTGASGTVEFQLWKAPSDLPEILREFTKSLVKPDAVALTMTAELCDCFETKTEGVHTVLESVREVFRTEPIHVWGTDGAFHDLETARRSPLLVAASNWLAMATVAARLLPDGRPGLLIDIGSTTTDLIPIANGSAVGKGRTDTQRLQTGELVYAGVRRTPLMALADTLPHRGVQTGLAAELFATTLDVFLTLGEIEPDPSDCSTADGRPATVERARDRLARMVGADRSEFFLEDALELARAGESRLLERLQDAAEQVCRATIGQPQGAVVCGSGSFLASRLAQRLLPPGSAPIDLSTQWEPEQASANCAFALVLLAVEHNQSN